MSGARVLVVAITLALGAVSPVAAAPAPDDAVRRSVKEILSGREYRRLRERARPKQPIDDCEGKEKEPKPAKAPRAPSGCDLAVGGVVRGLLYLLAFGAVAFALGLLVYGLIKRWRREGDEDQGDAEKAAAEQAVAPDTPPGELPAARYLEQALALADRGDHAGALRQLLLGAMSHCERAGRIVFRRGLTNRDYLRSVQAVPAAYTGLQDLVVEFEVVHFGRRDATAERFRRALAGFRRGFDEEVPVETT